MKHQDFWNTAIHVLSMYIFYTIWGLMIYHQVIWPIILIPLCVMMGNFAHRLLEDNYVDPLDTFGSWRAFKSLNKMMFLFTVGKYWTELAKRQQKLMEYQKSI
jgi:hypothetical protein